MSQVTNVSTGIVVRLQAYVEGIGPKFKIKLHLENMGILPAMNLKIALSYDMRLYKILKSQFKIPMMIPGCSITKDINLLSIDENGANDVIKVFIFQKSSSTPITGSIVNMPISELDIN
jgi:Bardet-Biedl syndrome 1 protein